MVRQLRYPTGVRPLLVDAAARRRRIEQRFVETLETAGFAEVILPILDYVDVYAPVMPRDAAKRMYRFVDRDGDLVALRSDFTPMVARALAASMAPDELPLRVYYRGDVIRCDRTRLGANREMFQIGAEIVGDASVDADVEILQLAASLAGDGAKIVYTDPTGALSQRLGQPASTATKFEVFHGETADASYYTGMRFFVYLDGSRRSVAQGGRYDNLYERFGAGAPAIGFTFTIDDLD